MIDQTLTTPPDAPSSNDIPTFRTRFDAFIVWIVTFVSQLTTVISQMNSTASTINDKEASTIASAQVAVSAANFKGTYTTQTTQVGESYLWNGIIYLVLVAGNTSPTASPSNWKAIGISDQIHSSSSKTTPIDADEFGIWDSISLSLKRLTWANLKATIINSFGVMVNTLTSKIRLADGDIIPIGDSYSGFASKYITYYNLKRSIPNGIRQTVQSASVDTSGYANFISIGTGLAVNISATTTNIKLNASGGATDRSGTVTADTTLTLSASATNYIYADIASDGSVTFGFTTLAPIYQQGGTPSVTSGQFTFNIGEMKGYVGNGTTAPQAYRVFIGEVVTSASSVTSVVNYALNGQCLREQTTLANGTTYTLNHNIGVKQISASTYLECVTADAGYAVGEMININGDGNSGTGSYWYGTLFVLTKKTIIITTSASGMGVVSSTGTITTFTPAKWKAFAVLKRGW